MKKIFLIPVVALSMMACNGGNKTSESCCGADSTTCAQCACGATTPDSCACGKEATPVAEAPVVTATGAYAGEFAGADGALKVSLTLSADATYVLVETPQPGKGKELTTKGTFAQEGDVLTLTNEKGEKTLYKVSEGKLQLLNPDGQLPENPEMYTLVAKQA